MKSTIFFSDVHLVDGRALHYPLEDGSKSRFVSYSGMDKARVDRLCSALSWFAATSKQPGGEGPDDEHEVVFLGDTFDLWLAPHWAAPVEIGDIFSARQNGNFFKVCRALIKNFGIKVTFVAGNHDDPFCWGPKPKMIDEAEAVLREAIPGAHWDGGWGDGACVSSSHGHVDGLFNWRRPVGGSGQGPGSTRYFENLPPLGYFITRAAATYRARTGKGLEVRPSEMFAMRKAIMRIGVDGVVATVWTIVCKAAGIAMDEEFVIPAGWYDRTGKITAERILEVYAAGIVSIKPSEILGEFDPFYVTEQPLHSVTITGHSHEHQWSHSAEADSVYCNVGCWCSSGCDQTCSALLDEFKGDHGEKVARVGLMHWLLENGVAKPVLVSSAEIGRWKP